MHVLIFSGGGAHSSKVGLLMAKSKKLERKSKSQHCGISLRKFSSSFMRACANAHHDKEASETKEWEDAICSVCLEFPHNAVLLICSSHGKGCRPYMCASNHRCSNCLEQYKKAYAQSWQVSTDDLDFSEQSRWPDWVKLLCPLCRGQVKGWTLVEPARQYFNAKKRVCMQDNCSFFGNYKQLRKHVNLEHPLARPWEVDPMRAEKWKKLEYDRDVGDVLTTIRSTMPGAIVMGDYVLERNPHGHYVSDDDSSDSDSPDDGYYQPQPAVVSGGVGHLMARRRGQLRGPAILQAGNR